MKRKSSIFFTSGFLAAIFLCALGVLFISLNRHRILRIGTILSGILSVSVISLYLFLPKIVGASDVRSNPQAFEGSMGIMGDLTVNDDGDMHFIINKCKHRKMYLYVKYPEMNHLLETDVIAYGKLERDESGEYCFCARKIISKKDDFIGHLVYVSRNLLESPRRWVHDNLPMLVALKKKLFTRG